MSFTLHDYNEVFGTDNLRADFINFKIASSYPDVFRELQKQSQEVATFVYNNRTNFLILKTWYDIILLNVPSVVWRLSELENPKLDRNDIYEILYNLDKRNIIVLNQDLTSRDLTSRSRYENLFNINVSPKPNPIQVLRSLMQQRFVAIKSGCTGFKVQICNKINQAKQKIYLTRNEFGNRLKNMWYSLRGRK
jgi:hypothetical protein